VTAPIRIALVGYGRIARAEHEPAIRANPDFELVGLVDPASGSAGLPRFDDLESMLASGLVPDAVALCQPPVLRHRAARVAIDAGLHVLLEKPPGATVAEVELLVQLAGRKGTTLFAAWHSRFAPAIPAARAWLAERRAISVSVVWHEDVRDWHPGQTWIWQPGGFGVFDPGINALSILTCLLETPLHVRESTLAFPPNAATPAAAGLLLETAGRTPVQAHFDWRSPGTPDWHIRVETDRGELLLTDGGARLHCDGAEQPVGAAAEYAGVYARFAGLMRSGGSEVDLAPLRLTADAFLRGRIERGEPLEEALLLPR
jgi:D-galactose 1-dehydrogenase